MSYKGNYPTVFHKIKSDDYKIHPFQSYKKFTFTSGSSSGSANVLQGIYSDRTNLPAIGSNLDITPLQNIDGSLQYITYFSIDHLFYKRKGEPFNTFGPSDLTKTSKYLFETASIFAIPQNKIGDGIKPSSFSFTGSVNLASDRYGNVIDVDIDSSSFAPTPMYYEGFNEYFDITKMNFVSQSNLSIQPGFETKNGDKLPIGKRCHFTGSSFIQDTLKGTYTRDADYAIAFFISGSNLSAENQLILAKSNSNTQTQYPFKIELSGSNDIIFSVSAGNNLIASITSSTNVESISHIVCQKTGSRIEMLMDGELHASATATFLNSSVNTLYTSSGLISNDDNLYIGGFSPTSSNLQGDLDEIRIFNQALTDAQIRSLKKRNEGGTFLQTNKVGNVFSKQGIVVISSPDYRYNDLINSSFTVNYRSTVTIYEHEFLARINAGSMNLSTNPTLYQDNLIDFKSFTTGSNFSPYFTTIGIYNDQGQLLAVGKTATPIKKRSDIDLNIILRIDTDF